MSYEWPVMPFAQQHPVRGFFGDPRIGDAGGTSFHFGIDVSVPDETPVYSVIAGTVHLNVAGGPHNRPLRDQHDLKSPTSRSELHGA
jgi:murein DD-endopeptidase MepM/ murein hydrolase activator NlpD